MSALQYGQGAAANIGDLAFSWAAADASHHEIVDINKRGCAPEEFTGTATITLDDNGYVGWGDKLVSTLRVTATVTWKVWRPLSSGGGATHSASA